MSKHEKFEWIFKLKNMSTLEVIGVAAFNDSMEVRALAKEERKNRDPNYKMLVEGI